MVNDAKKEARICIGLGYAIAKSEGGQETFISPHGFSLYYGDSPDALSLFNAWRKVSNDPELRRSVNNWHGQDPNDI
jgi:hypothetical protein